MVSCPACHSEVPEGVDACPQCGLSVELFDPIRQTVGLPPTDPRYAELVREILDAIGELSTDPPKASGSAEIATPARFPAPAVPHPAPVVTPPPPAVVPERPALAPAKEEAALRQRVDEYLQLGGRQGLNLAAFASRAEALDTSGGLTELEKLSRELYVQVIASLTDDFERLTVRRDELAGLIATPTPDAELERARSALASGDLSSAHRRIRQATELLDGLDAEWGPVLVLLSEGELLSITVRKFGGDPTQGLGPLSEGRRLARALERAPAETFLAQATASLWSTLNPLLSRDLARRKGEIAELKRGGIDVGPIVADLREFAAQLKLRNFAGAIEAYRRAASSVDAQTASASRGSHAGPASA